MNGLTIQKLRRKYMQITMISLVFAMIVMNALLYIGTMVINRQIIYSTLDYIIENNGLLENWDEDSQDKTPAYIRLLEEAFSANGEYQSPEFQFSTRYFTVYFDSDRTVTKANTNFIHAVSEEEALDYGARALARRRDTGRFGAYYYEITYEDDGSGMVVYIDGTNKLHSNNRILSMALIVTGFGIILAFLIARQITDHVVRNEIKNADIQKRFMTNISHELKTPLAVIRANTEMQEVLDGESEWTASNLRQVDRMNGLIQSLVMISKAEEKRNDASTERINLTEITQETVQNFRAMAINSGRTLSQDLDMDVIFSADEAQMRQLCSLLVDNAIKYCDEQGDILVALKHKGHAITLEVSNSYAEGAHVDYTRFFERFYRQDASHNVDRGGYGIGLSIAESIVQRYNGKIDAVWKQGIITFRCQFKSSVL